MKSFKNDGTFVIFSFSWWAAAGFKMLTTAVMAITVVMATITMENLFS